MRIDRIYHITLSVLLYSDMQQFMIQHTLDDFFCSAFDVRLEKRNGKVRINRPAVFVLYSLTLSEYVAAVMVLCAIT